MRALFSISFSFLFLIQTASPHFVAELLKLPTLFEHYQVHAVKEGSDIVDFLEAHYGDGKKAQDHIPADEHHSQLPFQGHHQCAHGVVSIAFLTGRPEFLSPSFVICEEASEYHISLPGRISDSPFQPPRA